MRRSGDPDARDRRAPPSSSTNDRPPLLPGPTLLRDRRAASSPLNKQQTTPPPLSCPARRSCATALLTAEIYELDLGQCSLGSLVGRGDVREMTKAIIGLGNEYDPVSKLVTHGSYS